MLIIPLYIFIMGVQLYYAHCYCFMPSLCYCSYTAPSSYISWQLLHLPIIFNIPNILVFIYYCVSMQNRGGCSTTVQSICIGMCYHSSQYQSLHIEMCYHKQKFAQQGCVITVFNDKVYIKQGCRSEPRFTQSMPMPFVWICLVYL